MNDILFTGNIKTVTNAMLNEIEESCKIVLCGETVVKTFTNKQVMVYPYRENDNEYRGIFKSYNFDTVVYFSRVLDGQKRLYDELENLENALYSASLSGVKHFIYLTTNDYYLQKNTTRTRLLKTCEDICKQFVDESDLSVLILRVPYLFSVEENGSHIAEIIKNALKNKEIQLDGHKEKMVDFLSDEDLGRIIARIHDEPLTGFYVADIPGGNGMDFETVAQIISSRTGVDEVVYKGYTEAIPEYVAENVMRQFYGWFPTHLLVDDIEDIVANLKSNETEVIQKKRRIEISDRLRKWILIIVELLFLFFLSEFLTDWTADNYRLDYVDFRLLFVVIIGIMHGTLPGIVASLFACMGYFAEDIAQSNFQIIFFNIENWLPFAAYFLSGTIMGHSKDKHDESFQFMKAQYDLLESKYVFLNDLYGKTLENKEEFSRQIIGYEDSFGKIYQVVKKLNSTMTDNIFFEAVFSIEELLKTTSVAIYTIGQNSHFARLNICSRDMNQRLAKSLDLSQFPSLATALEQNQNFYNADGLEGYPAYAAPVWKDGELHGAIFIWEAQASQMKMDYYNKFGILSGLVQDALIRAIEYGEQQLASQMVENTKVLRAEYFEEIVAMKEKMGKEGMSDYMLLEIEAPELSLEQMGEIVTSGIRNTDMIGMRNDKKIYLLLNQTNEASFEIVRNRLEQKGIKLIRK